MRRRAPFQLPDTGSTGEGPRLELKPLKPAHPVCPELCLKLVHKSEGPCHNDAFLHCSQVPLAAWHLPHN